MKTLLSLFLGVALVSAPLMAHEGRGLCANFLCSSRRVSDAEKETKRLAAAYPQNGAVRELNASLNGKTVEEKRKAMASFFALGSAKDSTDLEKQIERRLNDNQTDKVSNDDIRRLLDVFTGQTE